MIYLDSAATTPISKVVGELLLDSYEKIFGNNSSPHIAGAIAAEYLKEARDSISSMFSIPSNAITFTSGATESANSIIQGYTNFLKRSKSGRNEIIVSEIEHPAIYNTVEFLEREGFIVVRIGCNEKGQVEASQIQGVLNKNTAMVAIMHVNNETGVIQPINDLAKRVKDYDPNIMFLTDTVQSIGKLPFELDLKLVDAFFVSGHKIGAPKGIGFHYLNPRFRAIPLIIGGGQESGRRSGTVNVVGAYLLSKALEDKYRNISANLRHAELLRTLLIRMLSESSSIDCALTINHQDRSPYINSIAIKNIRSDILVEKLSEKGICVSRKSACSSHSHNKSRVLEGSRVPSGLVDHILRVSFLPETTEEEVIEFVKAIEGILQF